jgi:AcrR family transcriptional regulator
VTRKPDKRDIFLDRMAEHVLTHGLGAASLRPLAAAAGTSDRMLLYYFADKDEILAAVFARVAERFTPLLAATDITPVPAAALRARLWGIFRAEAAKPFIRLYLELCVAASRGEQPHRQVAAGMAEAFLGWTGAQLLLDRDADRAAMAALVLAEVDGLLIMDGLGLGGLAAAAVELR